jgi:hypothetical protein
VIFATQSFVLGVLVAAIFAADWPLRTERLPRLFYQITLALSIAILVGGFNSAFITSSEDAGTSLVAIFDETDGNNDLLDRAVVANTITIASGVLALIAGLYLHANRPTIGLAAILAGVLLIMSNTVGVELSLFTDQGLERGWALYSQFAVILIGTFILILVGFQRFDLIDQKQLPSS